MEIYRRKPFFFKIFFSDIFIKEMMKFRKFPYLPPSLRKMEKSRVKLLLDFHNLHLSIIK